MSDLLEYVVEPDAVEGVMTLRGYQTEAVDSCFEAWREYDAIAMTLATGLGKTVIASDIINRWPESAGRVLFIAHIRELIDQAHDKIRDHTTDKPSVEMGDTRQETDRDELWNTPKAVVTSIQTLSRRLHQFNPKDFGLIIIDEFHHAGAATYRRAWEHFKAGNENIKLLGITATLFRGDNISLGCMAEHVCYEMGIREGIDEGYLVPIKQQYIVVDSLDFSHCRTVAKDLNEGDLEEAMMGKAVDDGMTDAERLDALEKQERMLHAIAVPTVKESQGRPTLVFCVTVAHAERMAEVLRRYPGVSAEVVHGKTPHEQRKDIVERFRRGEIQMLVGVGCFTEGFDAPNVQVVAMARPTKQQGLYIQMIGRGTRPLPSLVDRYETDTERQEAIANSLKPCCIVLDFVGNSGKHKLVSTADILAGDMPPDLVEAAIEDMKESGEAEDIREAVWRKKEERDEEERKAQEERERKQKEAASREEARRAKLKAEAEYRAREVNPFGHEQVPERVQSAYRGGASDRQVKFLVSLGIKRETAMGWTKGQAGSVISQRSPKRGGEWYMRFGKHIGQQLNAIPHEYLRYMGQNCQSEDFQSNLAQYRNEYRESLRPQPEEFPE